jgi:hypothetical protein
MILV